MKNFIQPSYFARSRRPLTFDLLAHFAEAISAADVEIINEINRPPWSIISYEPWRESEALIRCPWCKSSHKFYLERQTVPANCYNCGGPF